MPEKTPPLLIAAYILVGTGILILLSPLLFTLQPHLLKGSVMIGIAITSFGIGEILNHPKRERVVPYGEGKRENPGFHKARNSCALGNLLDIFSLLLFFVGLSALLYGN